MAITKLMCIGQVTEENQNPSKHLYNALRYIANPEKTQGGTLVGGQNCLPDWKTAYKQMLYTKEKWGKTDDRQGYHFVISFSPHEDVSPGLAFTVTQEFVRRFLGDNYECLYSVHDDKEHIHGHLVFNSVSRTTGLKYHYANGDWKRKIQPIVNDICREHGLSTLFLNFEGFKDEDGVVYDALFTRGRNLSRKEWEERKRGKSAGKYAWANFAAADIDAVLPSCKSWEDVTAALRKIGWIVNDKRRDGSFLEHYSIKPPFEECRSLRPDKKCGYGYSRKGILERIEKQIYEPTSGKIAESDENMETEKIGDAPASGDPGWEASAAENWDWTKIYTNDKYKDYQNDFTPPAPVYLRRYPKGYKPRLTDYQKKHIANLYRTGKMAHYKLNEIPMQYRPNVRQLTEIQKQTEYILIHNIRTESDLVGRMLDIQKSIKELSDERHKLYGIRWGSKEALAFAYSFLKTSGKIAESTKIEERYRSFGKNLERQELAIELLSFFKAHSKVQDKDIQNEIQAFIHEKFVNGTFLAETEESFLKYIRISQLSKAPDWREKTVKRLEQIAFRKMALRYRDISSGLLNDSEFMKAPTYGKLKKWLLNNGMDEKQAKGFLACMGKLPVEAVPESYDQGEEIREKLHYLIKYPEKNTKAIDYLKQLRSEYPDAEEYEQQIQSILEAGHYDLSSLDAFMASLKNGEKEMQAKQKELEKEWEMCKWIREHDFNAPPRQYEERRRR